jgi:predicted dehydrogenase
MKHPDNLVRVGGVGTGRIFQHAHLRTYPRLWDRARLVGFYDVNRTRAHEARDKYATMLEEWAIANPQAADAARANMAELRVYDSLEAMLEQVDLIDVCTHAKGRMATAITALERGVHAMVEKPMARTWIEADRACRVAAAHPDVYLALNDDNVYDPKYRAVHDLLLQGVIGNVQTLTAIRGSRFNATSVLKSQASALDNGGGCLMDYGSHGLAGAWYALGTHLRPVKVDAIRIAVLFRHRVLEGDPYVMEVDDNAQIKILFEDPQTGRWVTVFLETTWCGGHIGLDKEKSGSQNGGYLYLTGDAGVMNATDRTKIVTTHWDGGESITPLKEYEGETISMAHEVESMVDCVRNKRPPQIDVRYGAEVIAMVEAAYLSALWGRAVTLDEFKEYARGFVKKYGDNEQAEEALLSELLAPYKAKK